MTWDPAHVYTPGELEFFLQQAHASLDSNDLEEARDFLNSILRSFPPDWPKIACEEFWIPVPSNPPRALASAYPRSPHRHPRLRPLGGA